MPAECLLVIDAGHSCTTLTPLLSGRPLHTACRRLDIGGKVLTNHLKDLISSRQFELQKEFFLVEQMKEDACFVAESSQDFADNLERCWKGGYKDPRAVDTSVVVEYVLPDYENIKRGSVRQHEPTLSKKRRLGLDGLPREDFVVLGNERFTVPELLFTPSDIGMAAPGVAGMVLDALESLPQGLWQPFLANVLVVGGTSLLPGFVERLEADLRQHVDETLLVRVRRARDPIKCVWEGGAAVARNEELMKSICVSKEEYLEHGDAWVRRVFAGRVVR